jgi:hypothetical protein
MHSLILKCFLFCILNFTTNASIDYHPLFVSVTEIEHNAKDKTLEISCKIFTDDFEKALRTAHKTKIDLLDVKQKIAMDKFVDAYIQKHLKINIDGKLLALKYIGYEKIEEGIYSYFEAENITNIKKINITNDLLYEYKKEQMGLIHVSTGGKRQSLKLSNPDKNAVLLF